MTTRLLKLIDDYDRALEGLEDEAIARLNQAIEASYRQLITKFKKVYPQLSKVPTLLPAQRELLITSELGHLLSVINPQDGEMYQELMSNLIKDANNLGAEMVEELIREIDPNLKVATFAKIPTKAAAITAKNSYQRLLRHGEVFSTKVTQAISQGLIQGWSNQRIAKVITESTKATKSNAQTIARTESANAAVGAAKHRYKESGIEYGIWITVVREVCPWCVGKSGKIFRLSEMVIPQHPRCRCGIIPVTPDWARNNALNFEAIEDYAQRVRQQSEGNTRGDKAPFELRPPRSLSLETLRRKAS